MSREELYRLRKQVWRLKKRRARLVNFAFVILASAFTFVAFVLMKNLWIEIASCLFLASTLVISVVETHRYAPLELVDSIAASSLFALSSALDLDKRAVYTRGSGHALQVGDAVLKPLGSDLYSSYSDLRKDLSLPEFLETVLVHQTGLVQGVSIRREGDVYHVRLSNPRSSLCLHVNLRDRRICRSLGCPLQSFVAESILDYTGRSVEVLDCSYSPSDLSINMKLRLGGIENER